MASVSDISFTVERNKVRIPERREYIYGFQVKLNEYLFLFCLLCSTFYLMMQNWLIFK